MAFTYTLLDLTVTIVKRSDGALIPNAPGNSDWQRFKDFCVELSLLSQVDADNNDLSTLITDAINVLPPPLPNIIDVKAMAIEQINTKAEATRLKYITGGSGQILTYNEKANESKAFKDAGYLPADGTGFPFIQADMVVYGVTSQVAADTVLATRAAWIQIGADIEKERTLGNKNVNNATDLAGVETAKVNAIAALGLL